jgi:hypothetical protein
MENELLAAHYESCTNMQHSAFRWTKKVVESCLNSYHIEAAMEIIKLFRQRYNNEILIDELEASLRRRQLMISIP